MPRGRVADPSHSLAHSTERTACARIMEWINRVIEERNLPFGRADVETGAADVRFPDIVVFRRPDSKRVLLLIEAKAPVFNPLAEDELRELARRKAVQRQAPYFATTNFRDLYCFITEEVNRMAPEPNQVFGHYRLSGIEDLAPLDDPRVSTGVLRALERFLTELAEVVEGRRAAPRLPVDELLVLQLHEAIHALGSHYVRVIEHRAETDRDFKRELAKWFTDQGWTFLGSNRDYGVAARQAAYLLANKLVFYSAIQPVRRLDPLVIPHDMTSGSLLQHTLEGYFREVLKIDYETVYTADFIDQLAFPDSREVVEEVKRLVGTIGRFDFATLGYDVIGRICERLIPEEERHILGQYFTDPDVVDLILRFCLKAETDKVLDPACGAGTFLVRAYQHKKLMNQRLAHEDILSTLWGNDIAKFAAHLSTINLAIGDLRSNENFPNVVQNDFFDLNPDSEVFPTRGAARQVRVSGPGGQERVVQHPRFFDCIVGNPPYTRHLEIEEIKGTGKGKIRRTALAGLDGKPIASLSRRAGIHAYFFVHGTKFLQTGGRMGFVVANSWLDADYGAGLQEHFLTHYKIVAIIESKVERWFPDAEVNTCIVILERAEGEASRRARDENLVRFVYLLKPLRHFVPPAESQWAKQVERLSAIGQLIRTILGHDTYYENDELRICLKRQSELWEEGWDPERKQYAGGKWDKYLRAPKIFFTIVDRAKDKLVPLREIAEVNEGRPTGAESFFFLRKEVAARYRIEDRFLRPGLLKPRGFSSVVLRPESVDRHFLTVLDAKRDIRGTGALRYIEHGERLRLNSRNTFAHKKRWYRIPARVPANLFLSRGIGQRFWCMRNDAKAVSSGSFTEIRLRRKADTAAVWGFLNSPVGWLLLELHGRTGMGGGMLKVDPTDVRKMPVIRPSAMPPCVASAMRPLMARPVGTVAEEAARPDRGELDRLVMGEVLGLSEEEQKEVYRAIAELVSVRHDRAQSVGRKGRGAQDVDVEALVAGIARRLEGENLGKAYAALTAGLDCRTVELPHFKSPPRTEKTLYCWRVFAGRAEVAAQSAAEARLLQMLGEAGLPEARIPSDTQALARLVAELEPLHERTKATIEDAVSTIAQARLRSMVVRSYWALVRDAAADTA